MYACTATLFTGDVSMPDVVGEPSADDRIVLLGTEGTVLAEPKTCALSLCVRGKEKAVNGL